MNVANLVKSNDNHRVDVIKNVEAVAMENQENVHYYVHEV